MSFESDTEQSEVESIGSRTHICETELGSDEDEEDMCYSDPEGPYIDEPIADEEWLLYRVYQANKQIFVIYTLSYTVFIIWCFHYGPEPAIN